jgi:hypothetical protein
LAGILPLAGVFLILSAVRPAIASESPSVYLAGGDSLSIWVIVDWDQPLPAFVQERLVRGIPATVGIRCELWRRRSIWIHQHLASEGEEMKVIRDPWGEAYSVLRENSVVGVDSMSALQEDLSHYRIRLPVQPEWCDDHSSYQIVATTFVRPLTAKDVGEVEDWLRGELRGFGAGVLGLPRGLFGIVRDLSGLGERTSKGSSERFQLSRLPDDHVRVLIPGREESSEVSK